MANFGSFLAESVGVQFTGQGKRDGRFKNASLEFQAVLGRTRIRFIYHTRLHNFGCACGSDLDDV